MRGLKRNSGANVVTENMLGSSGDLFVRKDESVAKNYERVREFCF